MNKLILSPLTLLEGEAFSTNDSICFDGWGSFHEAYGDRTVRVIQILAFGKAAERLKGIAVGSKLEASGEYRSEKKDLGNGRKEYLNIFLINKITRVGKPSEVAEEPQEAIAQPVATYKTNAVAPVYSAPNTPVNAAYGEIPF